jgi:hypothetical protein
LTASWSEAALTAADSLLSVVEARARASELATVASPGRRDRVLPRTEAAEAARAGAGAENAAIVVGHPAFVFAPDSPASELLRRRLGRSGGLAST